MRGLLFEMQVQFDFVILTLEVSVSYMVHKEEGYNIEITQKNHIKNVTAKTPRRKYF